MNKTKNPAGVSDAELKIEAAEHDGNGKTEEGMFACYIAGARVEVSGPAYVVAAIAGAVYATLKDF